MVIYGRWSGKRCVLSIKTNSLTFSVDHEHSTDVYSFDNQGRLWTAMKKGISYRRGLNGKIIAKWISPPDQHERRWLSESESDLLLAEIYQVMDEFLTAYQAHRDCLFEGAIPADIIALLSKISNFYPTELSLDVIQFNQVYKPIGILPPDQYMSVVLQMTEGCSYNRCTFCSFYRDRPFRIKTPEEFAHHIQNVTQYLGEGLNLRRTIFLGDANSLVIPMQRLVSLIETMSSNLPIEEMGGLFAFLDGFSAEKKSVGDYQYLSLLGLKRIYIGLESGSAELLNFLKKPGTPSQAVEAVRAIKAGGISVGVIILLGAGGHKYHRSHVEETVKVVNSMHLDMDDLIYFSELIESESLDYVKDAYQEELLPLTSQQRLDQESAIESGLKFSSKGGIPHISRYDIREFVY